MFKAIGCKKPNVRLWEYFILKSNSFVCFGTDTGKEGKRLLVQIKKPPDVL